MNQKEWDEQVKRIKLAPLKVSKVRQGYARGLAFAEWLETEQLLNPGDSVLDFGCGFGRVAVGLCERPVTYVGIDIRDKAIMWCRHTFRKYEKFNFILTDAYHHSYNETGAKPTPAKAMPVPAESIDLAISMSVFPHFKDKKECKFYLGQLIATLKPNGVLAFTYNQVDEKLYQILLEGAGVRIVGQIDQYVLGKRQGDPHAHPDHMLGQTLFIGKKES